MIRRNIRQRKEYLYTKSKELKERSHSEGLLKIKRAIANEKAMPTEFKKNKQEMMKDLELADDKTIVARTHVDDEYEEAKYRDPKILVTTSRSASQRLT